MELESLVDGTLYTTLLLVLDGFDAKLLVAVRLLLRDARYSPLPIVRLDLRPLALGQGVLRHGLGVMEGRRKNGSPRRQAVLHGFRCGLSQFL